MKGLGLSKKDQALSGKSNPITLQGGQDWANHLPHPGRHFLIRPSSLSLDTHREGEQKQGMGGRDQRQSLPLVILLPSSPTCLQVGVSMEEGTEGVRPGGEWGVGSNREFCLWQRQWRTNRPPPFFFFKSYCLHWTFRNSSWLAELTKRGSKHPAQSWDLWCHQFLNLPFPISLSYS